MVNVVKTKRKHKLDGMLLIEIRLFKLNVKK